MFQFALLIYKGNLFFWLVRYKIKPLMIIRRELKVNEVDGIRLSNKSRYFVMHTGRLSHFNWV